MSKTAKPLNGVSVHGVSVTMRTNERNDKFLRGRAEGSSVSKMFWDPFTYAYTVWPRETTFYTMIKLRERNFYTVDHSSTLTQNF